MQNPFWFSLLECEVLEILASVVSYLVRKHSPVFVLKREHFKLDWHRFNLKQKVAGKPVLSEDAFEETISGVLFLLKS